MKISFLIPAMVLYIIRESFCYDIQVGTVLFTRADLMRKCWTESDKGLLRARLIMQDVLPDPRCIDFSKPRAVSIILDYVYACFQIISTSTYGKLQNLMYLALADAVGGYLKAYVLPLTKKSYYAGLVSYEDTCKVFTLYDQIRDYLKTTGAGWAQPQKVVFKNIKISPLSIPGGDPEACKILYTIEKKGKLHCINAKCSPGASKLPDLKITDFPKLPTNKPQLQNFKENFLIPQPSSVPPLTTTVPFSTRGGLNVSAVKSKSPYSSNAVTEVEFPMDERNISNDAKPVRKSRELHIGNDTTEGYVETNEERKIRCDCCKKKTNCEVKTPKRIIVPLPILDDECDPHTIAVPFRKRPLRNLRKKTSAFILEHYYVAVLQCFIGKGNTRSDIKNFNSQFHSWLVSEVYPHLEDERWYPAFGGILRITETIKRFGAEARLNEPMSHDIAFMFRKGVGFDLPPSEEKNSKDKTRDISDVEYYDPTKSRRYLAFAVLAAAAVWCIFFCFCAYFCLGVRSKDSESGESGGSRTSACCPASLDSNTCLPEKKSVSFQFLVRFFKKNENSGNCQLFSKINENTSKGKYIENLNERNTMERKDPKKKLTFREEKDRHHRLTSRGDIPCRFVSNYIPDKPWSCTPFLPIEKKLVRKNVDNDSGEGAPPWEATKVDQTKTVQTLWKNPFLWPANITDKGFHSKKSWFKLASKKKDTSTSESISRNTNDSKTSTDKASSSYSCCNDCQHSSVTTTNTTSLTNLEEKCSSATMEYFKDVTSKHKPKRKDLKQKSSTESESDTDSCTSEY